MFAQTSRNLLTGTLFTTLLLAGCSHEVEPTKSKEETATITQQDANSAASLSLSEAALAVPSTTDRPQLAPSPQQFLRQYAGSYTGVMPCVPGGGNCVQGDMNVTLTLFSNGTALRTLSQQGQDNAMLARETAIWSVKRDGKTLLVTLPSRHQLSFELLPAHKLRFDHAELVNVQQDHSLLVDDDPIMSTLADDDMHARRYMLTMQ